MAIALLILFGCFFIAFTLASILHLTMENKRLKLENARLQDKVTHQRLVVNHMTHDILYKYKFQQLKEEVASIKEDLLHDRLSNKGFLKRVANMFKYIEDR